MSISWLITNILAYLLLPPANGLLFSIVGLMLLRRRPRLGRLLIAFGLLVLLALSLHVVALQLLRPLEQRYPPLDLANLSVTRADAVIVLGGGRDRLAPEFGGQDDVSDDTLARLRYGALLAKTMAKPVLVTGGQPEGIGRSEAETMRNSLQRDFGIQVRWIEATSNTTRENALHSAALLKAENIRRVVLVTHAWHMPRAVQVFRAAGFEVVPAPMAYSSARPVTPLDFMPSAGALRASSRALHEWIGMLWYRLRG
ncbi:MAG: YdcF family protein [Betaproteobacteria bacterium]